MTCPLARVVLVEDHPVVLEGLRRGLQEVGVLVCGTAQSAEEALRLAELGQVELALVDVSLPDMSGIELVRALRRAHPGLRCLMVSGHAQRSYAADALAAGACGYVLKGNAAELIQAVRSVLDGNVYLSRILRPQGA
jgi:two-component system nitrate/nitrite response regulator NarL